MSDDFNNEVNEDEKWEHSTSFLEFLQILSEMNKQKEQEDSIMMHHNAAIAKLQKSMFDSYVAVGFSEGQALDLTKNMINNLMNSVSPHGDK